MAEWRVQNWQEQEIRGVCRSKQNVTQVRQRGVQSDLTSQNRVMHEEKREYQMISSSKCKVGFTGLS